MGAEALKPCAPTGRTVYQSGNFDPNINAPNKCVAIEFINRGTNSVTILYGGCAKEVSRGSSLSISAPQGYYLHTYFSWEFSTIASGSNILDINIINTIEG